MSSEIEEQDILQARGFSSNLIRLRAYSQYGYLDRGRDIIDSARIWNLDMKILVKDKAYRSHILADYPYDKLPMLGSNNQVLMIDKHTHHYYDNQLLYLPIRLQARVYHHIPTTEITLLEEESREEGIYWLGSVPGLAPVREMLENISPLMLESTHAFIEDDELNRNSSINNNRHSEDFEVFFKPTESCLYFDCPIHQPIQRFVQAVNSSDKKVKDWFLVGLRLDHPEAVKYDRMKSLQELTKLANMAFNIFNANAAIWDSWNRLDELDN